MKPARVLGPSLLLALCSVYALRASAQNFSGDAYRYGAMARAEEGLGENTEALAHFNQSLALTPDPIIYSNRGDLKKKLKDIPGAIADYDAAIAMKPAEGLAILYGNRALMKHQSGDLDGAIADYSEVISRDPKNAVVYNNRGYAQITQGHRAAAIADYAKAAELEPKTAKFRENLANAKRDQGDYAGAIADYDKIVALDLKQPLPYFARGYLKQVAGNFAGAIKDYEKIIEIMPKQWVGYYYRGIARQAQGRLETALADYDKAVALKQDDSGRAPLYREIVLRRLKRATPDAELSGIAAKWKSEFYAQVGLYLSGALPESDFLDQARQADPAGGFERQCMASYFAGMTKLQSGDKAAAKKFLEQSVATKQIELPEFILARSELARLTKAP